MISVLLYLQAVISLVGHDKVYCYSIRLLQFSLDSQCRILGNDGRLLLMQSSQRFQTNENSSYSSSGEVMHRKNVHSLIPQNMLSSKLHIPLPCPPTVDFLVANIFQKQILFFESMEWRKLSGKNHLHP